MAEKSETDWMTAAEAYRLVGERNGFHDVAVSIATRAHVGLLRTWAALFRQERPDSGGRKQTEDHRDVDLPTAFWWATGHVALEQNWSAGDFATWIDNKHHWQAFGVKFERGGIDSMLAPEVETEAPAVHSDATILQDAQPTELPSDEAIKAKMLELSEMGINRDTAAKLIRQIAGFSGVGNEHARRLVAGDLPRGRKPRRK
jgi:hypothetical protein